MTRQSKSPLVLLSRILLFLSCSITATFAQVIVKPSAGEHILNDHAYTLVWRDCAWQNSPKIELWDGSRAIWTQIATVSTFKDSLYWVVPAHLSGDRFRIKISDGVTTLFSSSYFVVKAANRAQRSGDQASADSISISTHQSSSTLDIVISSTFNTSAFVSLHDVLGRSIRPVEKFDLYSDDPRHLTWSLNEFGSGTYILSVDYGSQKIVRKLTFER